MARTIIVTGAAGSLGRAVALRFSKSSDKLLLTDPDREAGQAVRDEVMGRGGQAVFVAADLHEALDVHNVMAEAIDSFETINVLAHCATHYDQAPLLDASEQQFDDMMSRNVRATFLINKAVAKQIIKQAGATGDGGVDTATSGAIVNVVSNDAVTVCAEDALFAASQGAMVQLTKAAAMTLSPFGARANVVATGGVKELFDQTLVSSPEQRKATIAQTPMGRRGEPKEVANVVHFLCGEQASFITGQVVFVDGGRLTLSKAAHLEGTDA